MVANVKTNPFAIVSFVSGIIAFVILGTLILMGVTMSPEDLPEPASLLNAILGLARSALDLCTLISLLMGILALRAVKQNGGTRKDRRLAWLGITLAVGPRALVAGYFILGLLLSQR